MNQTTRILVVDDEPEILGVFTLILNGAGYDVLTASTGQHGLQLAREKRPDLVLLDVLLPDLNGMEVCKQIKRDPDLRDVFVILISGGATNAAHKVEGLESGADDYMVKPLDPEELLARIRTIVRLRDTTAALRTSEQHFRQLADNIREVFWITNPAKNEMIYISPGYEEIWGRTCESLYASPMSWVEAIHPDDRERVMETALTKQISGQYDEVYRIVRPDGSHRWIHDRAFPIRDDSGEVYRVVGIAEDITQQKETEDALRNAEARYRSIFENATEGIFRTTLEGRILIANPALARMFGYPSPQEMMSSVTDVGQQIYVSLEKRAEMKRLLLEQGAIQGFEENNYRKDGSIIWVSLNAHTVYDASGAVQYFEGTIQDITERKRAEAQVAMLAHAVESTVEMICITDMEDRFTFVNRAFLRAYGYTEGEILGKPRTCSFPRTMTIRRC